MTEERNEEPSQQLAKRPWFLAGLYLGAILLGWGGSFAGSQYLSRSLVLPEGAELDSFEKKETSEEPNNKNASNTKNRIQSARPVDTYLQPLLNRSIFDSTQINTPVKIQEETDGSEPITDIDAQLLGTIVAIPAEYSLAMIKSGSAPWSKDYAVGDKLEDATVVEIKTREVIIRREDGRLEKLSLDKDDSKDKKDSNSIDKSTAKSEDGISKSGNNKYVVDQEVLDELLKNPEKLYSQIRAVPHKDSDGNVDGYRLSGIRRKSIFYKLGVKNGDIVHGVNGKDLNSMSGAMDAFNSLQNARDFSFDITRRRKKQTMEYEVR